MTNDTKTVLPKPLVHLKLDQLLPGPNNRFQVFDEVSGAPAQAIGDASLGVALDDVFGRCLRFDGKSNAETVAFTAPVFKGNEPDTKTFAMSVWIKSEPHDGGVTLISSTGPRTNWGLRAAQRLEFTWTAEGKSSTSDDSASEKWHKLVSPVPLIAGEWVHVAISGDGTKLQMFINGSVAAQTEQPAWIMTHPDDKIVLGGNTTFETDLQAERLRLAVSKPSDLILHSFGSELAAIVTNSGSRELRSYNMHTGEPLGYQIQVFAEMRKIAIDPRSTTTVQTTDKGLHTLNYAFGQCAVPKKFGVRDAKTPELGTFNVLKHEGAGFLDVATDGNGVWVATSETDARLFDEYDDSNTEIKISHIDPTTGTTTPFAPKYVAYDHHGGCFLLADDRTITPVRYDKGRPEVMTGDDGQPLRIIVETDILQIDTPQFPDPVLDDADQVMGFAVLCKPAGASGNNQVQFYGWDRGRDGRGRGVPGHWLMEEEHLKTNEFGFSHLAFNKDGRFIALGNVRYVDMLDTTTGKWSKKDGTDTDCYLALTSSLVHLALSPDAKTVVTVGTDDMLRVWDYDQVKRDAPAPKCDMSGLRLYRRSLAQNEVEEAALTDLPAVQVGTVFPLDFSLHNQSQQQALFLTNEAQSLYLEVTNVGQSSVVFPSEADLEDQSLAHTARNVFEIRFRPSTLRKDAKPETLPWTTGDPLENLQQIKLVPLTDEEVRKSGRPDHTADWTVARNDDPDGNDVIRLVHSGGDDVAKRTLLPGQTQYIRIAGVRVNTALGTHSSRVQLSYHLRHVDGTPVTGSRLHYLRLLEMSDADISNHVKTLLDSTRDIDTIRVTGSANADLIAALKHDLKLERQTDKELQNLEDALFFEHGGPLEASVIGTSTVVSDGITPNALTIRIKKRKFSDYQVLLAPLEGKPSQITLYLNKAGLERWCLLDATDLGNSVDVSIAGAPGWNHSFDAANGALVVTHTPENESPNGHVSLTDDDGAPVKDEAGNPVMVFDDALFDHVDVTITGLICGRQTAATAEKDAFGQRNIAITYTGIGAYGQSTGSTGWLNVAVDRARVMPTKDGQITSGQISFVANGGVGFHKGASDYVVTQDAPDAGIRLDDKQGTLHLASLGDIALLPGGSHMDPDAKDRGLVLAQGASTTDTHLGTVPGPDGKLPQRPTTKAHLDGRLTASGGVDAGAADISAGAATINGPLKVFGPVTPGNISDPESIKGSYLVPPGAIMMWHGHYYHIPEGWRLCDGQDGRPNLQSQFLVGACGPDHPPEHLQNYKLGDSGGFEHTTLTEAQIPPHTHVGSTGTVNPNTPGAANALPDGAHEHTGQETSRADNDDNDCTTQNVCVPGTNYYKNTNGKISGTGSDHKHSLVIDKTGGGGSHDNRPPFIAVFYIIKL